MPNIHCQSSSLLSSCTPKSHALGLPNNFPTSVIQYSGSPHCTQQRLHAVHSTIHTPPLSPWSPSDLLAFRTAEHRLPVNPRCLNPHPNILSTPWLTNNPASIAQSVRSPLSKPPMTSLTMHADNLLPLPKLLVSNMLSHKAPSQVPPQQHSQHSQPNGDLPVLYKLLAIIQHDAVPVECTSTLKTLPLLFPSLSYAPNPPFLPPLHLRSSMLPHEVQPPGLGLHHQLINISLIRGQQGTKQLGVDSQGQASARVPQGNNEA